MVDKRWHFSLWYFVLGFILLSYLQQVLPTRHLVHLSYGDFKQAVRAGQVRALKLASDEVTGQIKAFWLATERPELELPVGAGDWPTFTTVRPEDPTLVPLLDEQAIGYEAVSDSTLLPYLISWLLPFLFMLLIWQLFMGRMGSGGNLMAIGKSKAKVYVDKDIKVGFKDVAGIDEAVEELREVVSFLTEPSRYTRLGGRLPKGILLVGPPGTGKTLLARAVAGEAKVPFFSLSGSEFVELFVGVGAARVRDLFQQAQQNAPCIIFIDELDALGRARGVAHVSSNEEREQTLNQLLTEMDGFDTSTGVVLMAATNRPEILDPALLRAGRFDRHVTVDRPDVKGREQILKLHATRLIMDADVDLGVIAARTPGFAGADLANIANEAALLAARADKSAVAMAEFEEAIDRVMTGLAKKSSLMTPAEKHRVAHHESGHALVAILVPNADPVHKISIIPRGIGALGYTLQLPMEDRHLYTRDELLDKLTVLLGGRAAEEVAFGNQSTGAADDLQKATALARRLVLEFGMSEALGPVAYPDQQSLFLPGQVEPAGRYSDATAQTIDQSVQSLVTERYQTALTLLNRHKPALLKLAAKLEQQESLDGDAVRELLLDTDSEAFSG